MFKHCPNNLNIERRVKCDVKAVSIRNNSNQIGADKVIHGFGGDINYSEDFSQLQDQEGIPDRTGKVGLTICQSR